MGYVVDAVDNALKLLNCVAEHPNLGVTRLASKLGINKSRTYRMLCTLELHHFVTRDARTSTYVLGTQAFVIGVAAALQSALVRAAEHPMLALGQSVNETVMLRVREGFDTVCVARHATVRDARMAGSVCNRRPLGVGAAGKVLLAFALDAVRDEYLARREKTAPGGSAALADELDTIARRGYAIGIGEGAASTVEIAVPVRDGRGATIASLSVAGPNLRMPHADTARYLEKLQACSRAISAEFEYM
ncbi:IclR family transcriptional regulator [Burkholderia pseudomallei]|uniref:IclR family transcriptional regulator n=1 Tax=Burkholderia pseudomallei TaxID=28450 RepID=UPI000E6A15D3|nr:IclR family transcriptional regulator [Burkholderia pseudomallei]RIV71476.1 IclR family transcriptional regulator [Burkholderia pseudomallei]RIV79029.1 IclR family transcriptional regulator [Burkholderia pseudomallei]